MSEDLGVSVLAEARARVPREERHDELVLERTDVRGVIGHGDRVEKNLAQQVRHVAVVVGKGRVAREQFGCEAAERPPVDSDGVRIGTPEFMAPEILRAGAYTAVVDWWSLGCLTSELLTGTTPFNRAGPDVPTLLRMILWDPITVPTHPHVGPLERNFIMALLQRNPSARLGGQGHTAVLAHPWFLSTTVGVGVDVGD